MGSLDVILGPYKALSGTITTESTLIGMVFLLATFGGVIVTVSSSLGMIFLMLQTGAQVVSTSIISGFIWLMVACKTIIGSVSDTIGNLIVTIGAILQNRIPIVFRGPFRRRH